MNLKRRLDRLEVVEDTGPWCFCGNRMGWAMYDAADWMEKGKPTPVCETCGKPLLVEVIVPSGDEGRQVVAEMDALEANP